MSNITAEGHSIFKPPYFDGRNYTEWKERMTTFIQSVNFKLWFVIKNGPKIPTKLIDNEEVKKSEDEYDEQDMQNMELEAQVRYILYCALNQDTLKKISEGLSEGQNTAKHIWDKLDRDNSPTPPQVSNDIPGGSMDIYMKLCVPLHKLALKGNWQEAKRILDKNDRLKHAAIAIGGTTLLHIAAGTNHVHFVKKLVNELKDEHIALQDNKGNTAFCFAVANGNMEIVKLLMDRNLHLPRIRGVNGSAPIQFAAMQGKCNMAWFLYQNKTNIEFEDDDKKTLFFHSIKTGNYHMALKMARKWEELASKRDKNDRTALHLLALNQKPLDSCCHCPEIEDAIQINPDMKQHVMFQLVNFLWKTILNEQQDRSKAIEIIRYPSKLLFDAAKVGNFGFLSELISADPSLIWEFDDNNQTIIHTAVSYRHASIFNLVHEIGFIKDAIASSQPKTNTLLHLAAKLAPRGQLELVSGAAFQMCLEIIWFEEVKRIMPPSLIMEKNSDGLTAQELFTKEHEGLRKEGEEWMKRTAEFCMLISTVIATAVFAAAINIPGGIDDATNKPNYLNKTSFQVFTISDAAAFVFSATAILIFLSILLSRYAEHDFHKSLPLKLICGLIILFISIACMMVAFASAFFITYTYGVKVVPVIIAALAGLPLLLYIGLQFFLWSDILYSTFCRWKLFKPSKRMIYLVPKELEAR